MRRNTCWHYYSRTHDVDGCVSLTLCDISGCSRYRSYPCQLLGTAIVLPAQPPVFLFYLSVLAASAVFTASKHRLLQVLPYSCCHQLSELQHRLTSVGISLCHTPAWEHITTSIILWYIRIPHLPVSVSRSKYYNSGSSGWFFSVQGNRWQRGRPLVVQLINWHANTGNAPLTSAPPHLS